MNKYIVVIDEKGYDVSSKYFDDIDYAIMYYRESCFCSAFNNCTIKLLKNGKIINQAIFADLEEEALLK